MTLLELAKYKECSMQTIQSQIENVTGEIIPIKRDYQLPENYLKIIAPEIFQKPKHDEKKNHNSQQILLSHKKIADKAERDKQKKEYIPKIEVGNEFNGIVTRIMDFGVFVEFKNLSGLVHQSELSWGQFNHPSEIYKENDPIRVKVLKIDKTENKLKIALSHKRCVPNPWETVEKNLEPGSIIEGIVKEVAEFGVFIELIPGVEGLLHISKMTHRQYEVLKNSNSKGSPIKAVVLDIDINKKQIELNTLLLIEDLSEIWNDIDNRYVIGQSYSANVISIDDKGAWVELEKGLEILVPPIELQWPKTNPLINQFHIGKDIRVSIKSIDKFDQKLIGSIRECTPNSWILAEGVIEKGTLLPITILERKAKSIKIVTNDEFKLLGEIPLNEMSWLKSAEELEPADIPESGERIEARVIVWNAEKCNLKLSVRQIRRNPWTDILTGAEIEGTIMGLNENGEIRIHLDNGLVGLSPETELTNNLGEHISFKVIYYNLHTHEIRLSHRRIQLDNRKDLIVKSFFSTNKITDKTHV